MKTQLLKSIALAGAMGLAAGQANAYYLYPDVVTSFEDNDIERLVNANPQATDTILDEGDKLRGVLSIDALKALPPIFSTQGLMGGDSADLGDEEITGIFEIEVVDKVMKVDDNDTPLDLTDDIITYDFVFGPSASFEAVHGTDAVLALYNQAVGDLVILSDPTSCDQTSQAECETKATNGTKLFVFGFGDDDAEWNATGVETDDVALVAAADADAQLGDYNFALNLVANFTSYDLVERSLLAAGGCAPFGIYQCNGDGLIEMIGSGTINGGQFLESGYDARSDFQFGIQAAVPEPGSLALLGLGLAALGGATRRRNKKA